MELFCAEHLENSRNSSTVPLAPNDVALSSKRVIDKLLLLQEKFHISQDYFVTVQTEIRPHMRKVLVGWMIEVADEEHCEESVYCLAVNLVDRFLSLVDLKKSQLQLLGCVCLLLASKMRQSRPLAVDRLVYFSDYSVSASEIKSWELVVLNVLEWNPENVIACDFFGSVLEGLVNPTRIADTRRKAGGILSLLIMEPSFIQHPAMLLAASCVGAAVKGFHWSRSLIYPAHHRDEFIIALSSVTKQRPEKIVRCMMDIDTLVNIPASPFDVQAKTSPHKTVSGSPGYSNQEPSSSNPADCITPTNQEVVKFQPETPTDVQDVNF